MKKRELERFHRNRQLVHSAYVYLACFLLDCIDARTNMRYLSPQDLEKKYLEILGRYFGNLEEDGQLQEDLNKSHDGILYQLKEDFPQMSRTSILVFSYYAVGLPVPLIRALANLSFEGAARITKTQMKNEIKTRASPRREEYLMLLEREKLPNWVRNAIFA